jgi:hypothetical protein
MRGKFWVGFAAGSALVVLVGMASVAGAAGDALAQPSTVHVVEHPDTDIVIDTGDTGDTTGDLLTFHNLVYDATDTNVVGRDQGSCIRIDPGAGTWECMWTTFLPGGHITVEGPFYDTRNSVLAITGGTGIYKSARGRMNLMFRDGGTKFDFVFHVEP